MRGSGKEYFGSIIIFLKFYKKNLQNFTIFADIMHVEQQQGESTKNVANLQLDFAKMFIDL
jgi:hypothetical protein